MLDPAVSTVDAARIALLPLECSARDIERLFNSISEPKDEFTNQLDAYGRDAVRGFGGPDEPPNVNSIGKIATYSTFTALRVEFANPLPGSPYYEQFPEYSAERRMMNQPLRKHPGLSWTTRNVGEQYVYNVLYAFQELLPEKLQREFVAILFAPDPEFESSTSTTPEATYQTNTESLQSITDEYTNRISRVKGGFKVPNSSISGRCLVDPLLDHLYLPSLDTEKVPPLFLREDGIVIPNEVVLQKLANYAWHGWHRLVHTIYNAVSQNYIQSLIEETPRTSDEIKNLLKDYEDWKCFSPYYGSTARNPRLDPDARDLIARPDKRLVTIVDAIRASRELEFGEPILLSRLFDEICRFFPSPDRPGNDVTDLDTLQRALDQAVDDRITSVESNAAYEIPGPIPTPFYPMTNACIWKQYRHGLAKLTGLSLETPDSSRNSPEIPKEWQVRESSDYTNVCKKTMRAAATQQKYDAFRPNAVDPLVSPNDIKSLSSDEILFLTRIGLGMERRIKSNSLIESMKTFDEAVDGSKLDIDLEKLLQQGHLNESRSRRTYYSIPQETRRLLNIPNVSHDGWGERSPSEGTIHRVGIDLCAFFIASQPNIDRVVRYCDIWRLQNTACWDTISHLNDKRIDVIGFSQGQPKFVSEVETQSGDKTDTRSTLEKLEVFPDDGQRYLITPNGVHLRSLINQLSKAGYFDSDFGAPKNGGYRPADVRAILKDEDILGDQFDDLFTYANLRNRLPESFEPHTVSDTIVGTI